MAERVAARLSAQERQIEALSEEISLLRDGLSGGCFSAEIASGSELEDLRSENEKLRYRLVHLQRALQAEIELETPGQAGARTGRENKSNCLHEKHEISIREKPKVKVP
ncbi:threonine--tRNA ligase 1, cytoplasmic isoform X1, partial [Tachysurus ichikawai]